ncbi:MAG: rane protein [Chthonomonadaceae bacterium]|nr:rane protein [Chthonomonadaceae bacterium]
MAIDEIVPASKPMTLEAWRARRQPHVNVNKEHEKSLKGLERLAIWVTDRVGTMGFFLVIFAWTVVWCGYNILASEVPALHWKAFDPFPAFVAYLLISNVIQILLMPLIMVGQNLQGRHSEMRAEHDLNVNVKAEEEIEIILMHLEHQQAILMQLVEAQGIKVDAIYQDTVADNTEPRSVVG